MTKKRIKRKNLILEAIKFQQKQKSKTISMGLRHKLEWGFKIGYPIDLSKLRLPDDINIKKILALRLIDLKDRQRILNNEEFQNLVKNHKADYLLTNKKFLSLVKPKKLTNGQITDYYLESVPRGKKAVARKGVKICLQQLDIMDTLYSVGSALDAGVALDYRLDNDGEQREYFGFPVTMPLEKRIKHLTGRKGHDIFAKVVMGLNNVVDQKSKQPRISETLKRNKILKFTYKQLLRKKGCKPTVAYKYMKDDFQKGFLKIPTGTKFPRNLKALQSIIR